GVPRFTKLSRLYASARNCILPRLSRDDSRKLFRRARLVLRLAGPVRMSRPLLPNVPVRGAINAAVLKYSDINCARGRLTSRNGSPTSLARWLPAGRELPISAVSAPVMIENGAPELFCRVPDNCQPPKTRANGLVPPK